MLRLVITIALGANFCLNDFSISLIRYHVQDNLQKKGIIGGLQFLKVRIHDHRGGEHDNSHTGRHDIEAVAEGLKY